MSHAFRELSDEDREKLVHSAQPARADPMLATLTHDTFSDPEWIYERKLDGERALAFLAGAAGAGPVRGA